MDQRARDQTCCLAVLSAKLMRPISEISETAVRYSCNIHSMNGVNLW